MSSHSIVPYAMVPPQGSPPTPAACVSIPLQSRIHVGNHDEGTACRDPSGNSCEQERSQCTPITMMMTDKGFAKKRSCQEEKQVDQNQHFSSITPPGLPINTNMPLADIVLRQDQQSVVPGSTTKTSDDSSPSWMMLQGLHHHPVADVTPAANGLAASGYNEQIQAGPQYRRFSNNSASVMGGTCDAGVGSCLTPPHHHVEGNQCTHSHFCGAPGGGMNDAPGMPQACNPISHQSGHGMTVMPSSSAPAYQDAHHGHQNMGYQYSATSGFVNRAQSAGSLVDKHPEVLLQQPHVPPTYYQSAAGWSQGGHLAVQQGRYNGPTRKYYKYHLQRLQTAATHILFYLVKADHTATLAVVGTDMRGTGHFVYSSIPDFTEAVPLRCTNRVKVMEYLAALGATDAADPEAVLVPDMTPQQLEMLLTSDPMFSKPRLDRQYTSWREEGGKLPDGRHYKQFIMIDDNTGFERVVVTAEDSHRRDRRYTYMTVPELGGFKLENGNAVKEWLDLMVGRVGPGSTNTPSSTRYRGAAACRLMESGGGLRLVNGNGRSADHQGMLFGHTSSSGTAAMLRRESWAQSSSSFAMAASAPSTSEGGVMRMLNSGPPDGAAAAAAAAPTASGGDGRYYQSKNDFMSSAYYVHDTYNAHVGVPHSGLGSNLAFKPAPTQNQNALPAEDGLNQGMSSQHEGHYDPDPMSWQQGAAAPTPAAGNHAVVATPAAYDGAQHTSFTDLPSSWANPTSTAGQVISHCPEGMTDDQGVQPGNQVVWPEGGGRGGGAVEEAGGGNNRSEHCLVDVAAGGGGSGGVTSLNSNSMCGDGQTGQDILEAFKGVPQLLKWVADVPSAEQLHQCHMYAERLLSLPCNPPLFAYQPSSQEEPASVHEAMDILKVLESEQVNLRLLEITQIGRIVAGLRFHTDAQIADFAGRLALTWRQSSVAALEHARRRFNPPQTHPKIDIIDTHTSQAAGDGDPDEHVTGDTGEAVRTAPANCESGMPGDEANV